MVLCLPDIYDPLKIDKVLGLPSDAMVLVFVPQYLVSILPKKKKYSRKHWDDRVPLVLLENPKTVGPF